MKNGKVVWRDFPISRDEEESRTIYRTFRYNIYPSYDNTIAFLEQKGVYDGNYLNVDEIASITVANHHNKMYEKQENGNASDIEVRYQAAEDLAVSKTFMQKNSR